MVNNYSIPTLLQSKIDESIDNLSDSKMDEAMIIFIIWQKNKQLRKMMRRLLDQEWQKDCWTKA